MTEADTDLKTRIDDALAQADRLLARPGTPQRGALGKAREQLARQSSDWSWILANAPGLLESLRSWLSDLEEAIRRELVRGDVDANRRLLANARVQRGDVVRIRPGFWKDLAGLLGIVTQIRNGRRVHVSLDGGGSAIFCVDDLDVVARAPRVVRLHVSAAAAR